MTVSLLPGAIRQVTEFGTVTIDGTGLNNGDLRWCAYQNSVLWTDWSFRGDDRLMPRSEGRRPKRRRKDSTRYMLPMVVSGAMNSEGTYLGLSGAEGRALAAVRDLQSMICYVPTPIGDGTRTIVYDAPNGETWTAPCHVLDLIKNEFGSGLWDGDLEMLLTSPWVVS